MSDFLLELSQNPQARRIIKSAGLPIPTPERLRRDDGPWEERPLYDRDVAVAGSGGALATVLADTLARAGANPRIVADSDEALAPYAGPGEAFGRPATRLTPGEVPDGMRVHGLVFDATGLRSPEDLRALYDFFHPWIGHLGRCGRAIVLGRPARSQKRAAAAAAMAGLEGFARSVAKEIGKTGATAHVVWVDKGAEDRLPPLLRFLLSPRSAFVTAQTFHVTREARAASPRPMTRPLEGRVALVTGAARGIGAATARLMAQEGAHVVVLDRPADDGPASRVAREVDGSVLLVDVSDEHAPGRIVEHLQDRFGGVDIVVHNAGVTRDKTLKKMSAEKWDQAVDVNLGAVVRITEALLKGTLRDGGRIVVLSSIAGLAGNVGQTNYAASKSGMVGFVEHLAAKLAKNGITANAVAPGFIETRLTAAIPVMIREAARRMSALGQGGLPEDVGQTITFLASPGADGITGSVVRVCGGALVGR